MTADIEPGMVKAKYPYEVDTLLDFVDELHWRTSRKYDNLIGNIGPRGRGKSTRELKLAYLVDPDFNMKEQIAYLPTDILEISSNLGPRKVIAVDEAGEAWNSKQFATKINKALFEAFTGNRWKNQTFIFCCPLFRDIDPGLRRYLEFLIDCKTRRYAVVYDLKLNSYNRKAEPYRYTKFNWLSAKALPRKVERAYERVKIEKGESRIAKYLKEIQEESGQSITPEEVIDIILEAPEEWCKPQGWVDENKVLSVYQDQGITKADAVRIKYEASRTTRRLFRENKLNIY